MMSTNGLFRSKHAPCLHYAEQWEAATDGWLSGHSDHLVTRKRKLSSASGEHGVCSTDAACGRGERRQPVMTSVLSATHVAVQRSNIHQQTESPVSTHEYAGLVRRRH